MTKLIMILFLITLALPALAVFTDEMEISGYRGILEERSGHFWLKGDYGDDLRLLLAPRATLDSLEFAMAPGDTVYVEGLRDKDLFLVGKLWNESHGSSLLWLRHLDWGDLGHGSVAAYNVNGAVCIGCRLCVTNCPTGAITMVKGKAVIDAEKCTECGICISGHGKFKGCPVGAIKPK